jgi:hypothetical protein
MKPKRWHEANEMDFGDISEFDAPTNRNEEVIRLWKEYYDKPFSAPQRAAVSTAEDLGMSIGDVCRALETDRGPDGAYFFADIIRAQAKKGGYFTENTENTEDIGDISVFEEPDARNYEYSPLGDIPIKKSWPASIKKVIEWIQFDKFDTIDVFTRHVDNNFVINMIASSTGEVRQLEGEKADQVFKALNKLGLLKTIHHMLGNDTYEIRFKENTMKKKVKWSEANEIIPTPEPTTDTDDFGDVAEFPSPTIPELTKELIAQPTYFDAWLFFDTHYDEFNDRRFGIPYGSGGFERWWVGANDEPLSAPSPEGKITKDDIDKLERSSDFGQGEEVFGLFINSFYNGSAVAETMDDDTLIYLIQKAMEAAVALGAEETITGEFKFFEGLPDDEVEELIGTKHAARGIVKNIRDDIARKNKSTYRALS